MAQKYKKKLLEAHKDELKALSPEYSETENLDWLWGSFNRYSSIGDDLKCSLCYLALNVGRSALNNIDINHILNNPNQADTEKLVQIKLALT